MNIAGSESRTRGRNRAGSRATLLSTALLAGVVVSIPATTVASGSASAAAPSAPSAKVLDKTVTERNASGLVAQVKVQLSRVPTSRVTVDFTTVNGTAGSPADFAARSGTLRFPAGTRTKTISVPIKGDLLAETSEVFKVRISNPFRARIADAVGAVTVLDNDSAPGVSVANASTSEGHAGATALAVPVSLSAPSGAPVSVPYSITPGSATLNSDYAVSPVTGTLEFPAGTQTRNLSISVLGDADDETDETVNVTLLNPVNAVLVDGDAVATIRDDDGPNVTINDVTRNEGWTPNNPFSFNVSLSSASPQPVTVNYATANGSAAAGSDYTATSGTLTFAPGQVSRTVTAFGQGDLNIEGHETFAVNLSAPVNGRITDPVGVATLINDDFSSTDEGRSAAWSLGGVSGDSGSSAVSSGTQSIQLGDADWYRINVSETAFELFNATRHLNARVNLVVHDGPAQSSGDVNMQIVRADGAVVGTSSAGGTSDEQVFVGKTDVGGFFADPDDSTFFYVRVFGLNNTVMNNYSLTVTGNSAGSPSFTVS